MRLRAFKVIVKFKTPLVGHVLREEPFLVTAQSREIAARIMRAFFDKHNKIESEIPFVDVKDVRDCGPIGEGME